MVKRISFVLICNPELKYTKSCEAQSKTVTKCELQSPTVDELKPQAIPHEGSSKQSTVLEVLVISHLPKVIKASCHSFFSSLITFWN